MLKKIADWLLGAAEEVKELDEKMSAIVNKYTRNAFFAGGVIGLVLGIFVGRAL